MSFLSSIASLLLGEPAGEPVQARSSDYPSWETQLASFHRLPQPWAIATPDEALTVPSIFRAVSLIANTVGMMNPEAFRSGQRIEDPFEVPRIVVRPNPFTTPRDFYRDTAYYMATRGLAWWYIAARDPDGNAASLWPVPPWEVTVEKTDDRLRPRIKWGDREMRNEDMRRITYMPDREGLYGVGPLQVCGAAVSVAVEAQEWAANFYSGSIPSIVGETDMDLTETEAEALDSQWNEKPSNLPRWLPLGITLKDFGVDPSKAQLTDIRRFNDGQSAVMFGIPGSLLEYSVPGSSLTYQNVEGEYTKLVRTCLQPNYLEPIEQAMSDLLTRSTTVRFSTSEITRADLKTRADVYKTLTESGVAPEVAARIVGLEAIDPNPSNVAPVPMAAPSSIPNRLPPDIRSSHDSRELRCDGMRTKRMYGVLGIHPCNALLSRTGSYVGPCPKCNKQFRIEATA